MDNSEYAAVFEDIAAILRKKKENIFKIRAYENIARRIRELKEPVETIVKENRIDTIPGAGEAITKKLQEMTATGKLQFYEKLKSENPPEGGL
jgi:DNA polymerase (family X)